MNAPLEKVSTDAPAISKIATNGNGKGFASLGYRCCDFLKSQVHYIDYLSPIRSMGELV